jgi:hypothetical protein
MGPHAAGGDPPYFFFTIKECNILKQAGAVAFTGGFINVTWRNILKKYAVFVEASVLYAFKK